mgnify:CR=1 FL=1
MECSYGLLEALLNSNPKDNSINVMALFDNEEIGSRTRQGAASMMLHDTLERISLTLGFNYLEHKAFLASSKEISFSSIPSLVLTITLPAILSGLSIQVL